MFHNSIRSLRAFSLVALSVGLAFSAAPAADPTTRPPTITDIVLARSALAAIDADPKLSAANLLVSVVDRIAVVGGPVASNELVKRAETVVKGVPGIVEVKNRCFVQEGGDPLLRSMAAQLPSKRRLLATELPGVVASPKTGVVEEYRPAPGDKRSAAVESTAKSVVALRPMNPGASVLLPPVGIKRLPRAPEASPAPTLLTSRPADALAACEAIRRADRRFAGLNLSLANGAVEIVGTAARAADAWDLAQKIRVVPGVPRVILGKVDVR